MYFLIGYMASGKTTAGKRLARLMQLPFYDLDEEIVKAEGCTIARLFEAKGETYFRECEHQILLQLIHKKEEAVISVGGGAPLFHENMALMNQSGITVYLKTPVGRLARRLRPGKEKRPLLRDIPDEALESFVGEHLRQRESVYNQAQLVVDLQEITIPVLAGQLKQYQSQ